MPKQPLIVILGPTASGKTKLAVKLAVKYHGEIVSADSRQVYRGMDIGTGKDLAEYSLKKGGKRIKIPYHLIDVANPRARFSLARYQKLAYQVIDDILQRGKVPFLVGGSGLYIQAVVDGYKLPPAKPNQKLRKKLSVLPLDKLLSQLKKLDKKTFEVIDKKNRRRVQRALEIILVSGKPLSRQRNKSKPPYNILLLGVAVNKETLDQKIDKRLKKRFWEGMVEEVKKLHARGVSWKRLDELGLEYRYISRYLRGLLSQEKMEEELAKAIKNFAKRQMTWFKRDQRIKWIKSYREADKLVKKFLIANNTN